MRQSFRSWQALGLVVENVFKFGKYLGFTVPLKDLPQVKIQVIDKLSKKRLKNIKIMK